MKVIYKTYELNLQSGDIILYRNEFIWNEPITWLAALERFFAKSKYNHGGVIVSSWEKLMINEAMGSGVICRPLINYLERKKSSIIILRPKLPIVERDFCVRANSKLGTKYEFIGLIHQLWYRISGIWVGHTNEHSENKMICSEYAAWCYGRPNWWAYSPYEIINDDSFFVVFEEEKVK